MLCIKSRIEDIKNLSVNLLDQRQPMLVELMADIVNGVTNNGSLTSPQGYPETQTYWPHLVEKIQEAGFEFLGNGYFSVVYKHHLLPGKVLKVGLKKEDSAAAYVAFCRMHEGREGLPVIHDVQRFEGCYIVVLDELLPITCDDWYTKYQGNLISSAISYEEVAHRNHLNVVVQELPVAFRRLLDTCRMIHDFFSGIAKFDMHHNNAMINPKTGRIVITDPVSFTVGKEEKRVVPKVDRRHRLVIGEAFTLSLRDKCQQDVIAAADWMRKLALTINLDQIRPMQCKILEGLKVFDNPAAKPLGKTFRRHHKP